MRKTVRQAPERGTVVDRNNRRVPEIEVLEDRCTPAIISPIFSSSTPPPQTVLPNGTPASQAPTLTQPNGALTIASFFNFAAPSQYNLDEIPLPNVSLILQSNLPGNFSGGMPSGSLAPTAFNVNNATALETASIGTPAQAAYVLAALGYVSVPGLPDLNLPTDLGLGPSQLGSATSAQLLVSSLIGPPQTAPFPLPTEYESLPVIDRGDLAIAVPEWLRFESATPFLTDGFGRSSYEGGNGAGRYAPPSRPPAAPPAATPPPMAVDWLDELEIG